ncbi:hypothetical protein FRX31_006690 [Thalictrum thalictroides]|uniref:Uncharacterized protein n=1 Tax=Thalictrum thalictroides TaxID=46969 RepID=A0A7J6X302_THATH|nr:hypothetical protein FRX31_006690 [Thalictrum thalictroides]
MLLITLNLEVPQFKVETKTRAEKISTKRQAEEPKLTFMVEGATLETPIPYDLVYDIGEGGDI